MSQLRGPRELDAYLHRLMFGEEIIIHKDRWLFCRVGEGSWCPIPHYSTDKLATLDLAEKLREMGWAIFTGSWPNWATEKEYFTNAEKHRCELRWYGTTREEWKTGIFPYGWQHIGIAETLALALARAAEKVAELMEVEHAQRNT